MTLKEGASQEINSRWPEHRQRNVALMNDWYGKQYHSNMVAGIQLVRDCYNELKSSGATTWSVTIKLAADLDDLLSESIEQSYRN
mgnify:CR=1 FL=1|tara:strand:+ start:1122 stop:1376 length:255 start_codon:yes stop_codon:yes gene_type:complete